MGKKAKVKAAAAAAAVAAQAPVEELAAAPPVPVTAESEPEAKKTKLSSPAVAAQAAPVVADSHPEEVYDAAAIVFFTRDGETGAVAKVLVAVEDRKVQASYLGLDQKGKVRQRVLLFPMGRREKKDKNDSVETAKREYIEETGDFGGLSKHLDFADFTGELDGMEMPKGIFSGKNNMALFFAPSKLNAMFCEVPAEDALKTHRAAVGGFSVEASPKAKAAPAPAAEAEEAGGAAKKKRKREEQNAKPSPSFHVGQCDHLEPLWIDASVLRTLLKSNERCPAVDINGQETKLFPTAGSILRLQEARQWLEAVSSA